MSYARQPVQRRTRSPVMFGRERERALLRELLDHAMHDHGSLVLVSGEAGIGKTTLIADLVAHAVEQGALALAGNCYDLTTTPPYGPWVELLFRSYTPGKEQPPVPQALRDLTGIGSSGELYALVSAFLEELAGQQPLVLVLEDLHWSDTASLDFLRYFGRELAGHAVLLIASYRDDEITRRHQLFQLIPLLVREAGAERIVLHRFDALTIRGLVERTYQLQPQDTERLAQHIAALSDGNPFYALELLRALEDDGVIKLDEAGLQVGELSSVAVPPLLRQVLDARLSRLHQDAQDVLEIAAVIGHESPFAVWQAVAEVEERQALAALDEALQAQLVEEVGRGGVYRFRHALIREALYERQSWPLRRRRHLKTAEQLAQLSDPDPDAVAYHFQEAGDQRAVEWLTRAGERAGHRMAWLIAADRYVAAVKLLGTAPEMLRQRADLLVRLSVLFIHDDPRQGLLYAEEAYTLAVQLGDTRLAAHAQHHRGTIRCYLGDIRAGLTDLRASLAQADDPGAGDPVDPSGVSLRAELGFQLANAGHFEESTAFLEAFINEHPDLMKLSFALGRTFAILGRPAEARRAMERAIVNSSGASDEIQMLSSLASEAYCVTLPYYTDDLEHQHRLAQRMEESRSRLNTFGLVSRADAWPALPASGLSWQRGDWDGWVRFCVIFRTNPSGFWGQFTVAMLGTVVRLQGKRDVAWQQVHDVLPQGPATAPGDCSYYPATLLQLVACELCLDVCEFEHAHEWLAAHDDWLNWNGTVLGRAEGQLGWARYYRCQGDLAESRSRATLALGHAAEPRQPIALIQTQRFLGQLEVDERNLAAAHQHLAAALSLATTCELSYEVAETRVVLAELALLEGDIVEANGLLRQARAIGQELGAALLMARIDMLQARLDALRGKRSYPFGLTEREVEVLQRVTHGLTDPEVAEELFISPRTVGQHLRSIYNKLNVANRTEATRVAVEREII